MKSRSRLEILTGLDLEGYGLDYITVKMFVFLRHFLSICSCTILS